MCRDILCSAPRVNGYPGEGFTILANSILIGLMLIADGNSDIHQLTRDIKKVLV